MPKPGVGHERLARLAGAWGGDEQLSPSPWGPGGIAYGRFEYRFAVDGMALLQDYEEEKQGEVTLRAHGVFMIDPASGDVLWWWFDSLGFPPEPPARGQWDGDVLRFETYTAGLRALRHGLQRRRARVPHRKSPCRTGRFRRVHAWTLSTREVTRSACATRCTFTR